MTRPQAFALIDAAISAFSFSCRSIRSTKDFTLSMALPLWFACRPCCNGLKLELVDIGAARPVVFDLGTTIVVYIRDAGNKIDQISRFCARCRKKTTSSAGSCARSRVRVRRPPCLARGPSVCTTFMRGAGGQLLTTRLRANAIHLDATSA
jgi:hypothetical protein